MKGTGHRTDREATDLFCDGGRQALWSLFVRKFRFLGDQKFKQVELTREQ